MRMLKGNVKRILYMATVLVMSVFLCTGCSNEREEKQQELRLKGISLLENGKYEDALEKFQAALDLSLGDVGEAEMDICFYKAEALYKLGQTEEAMTVYTAIIDFNEDPRAYFQRGNLYYSLDDEENALKDYEQAIEHDKKNYEVYIGVFEALNAHGKEMESQECLNAALEISGKTAYDKMQKGRILFFLGENNQALSLLEEAVKGKEAQAYYYLAEIYSFMGDEASAQSSLKAYMESGSADAYSLFDIANDELSIGNAQMAIECLTTALQLESVPNKQLLMKTLVIAYEQDLDFDAALELMQEYVKAYPEDEEAKRELTFLETR